MNHREADLAGRAMKAHGAAEIVLIDHRERTEPELVGASDERLGGGGAIEEREGRVSVKL
jgi:hypothetical protein